MPLTRRSAIKKGSFAAASLFSSASLLSRAFAESPALSGATSKSNTFSIREIYCPAHFGNSYEAMWPREMKAYLAELKWWGFNRYSDWITTTDVRNPYASDATWDLATEQLDRKKKAFLAAQELGLELNLILTANHVYLDQLRPEIAATKNKKIFGQLVCPSQPAGRKIILENVESWFRDLAQSGLQFSAWTGFAYDYGGCDCPKCNPWILTFARLTKEIQTIAQKYHPKIEPWFCSWWWTPEEHVLFNDWAAKEAPGWLKGMTLHLEYDQTRFKDVDVPNGCKKIAFIHNGYADIRKFDDIYAKWGATVAPERIPTTLRDIAAQGADGFQAYSEGVFEDANKAILGGISSGKFPDAKAALKNYAERYFAATGSKAERWSDWLAAWGVRKNVKLPAAAEEFEKLSHGLAPTWRLEHWRSKLKLEHLDRAIGTPKENAWTAEKLKLADEFWGEQEHLQRDVYKLGPLRHVFARKFIPPEWYDSWRRATKAAPKTQIMSPEA
ncbi:MAG: hypothetical protein JWM68_5134 [Verrucomicrobiales bacterium]|nr:hypothetical protein [Verrucomicrobiales bacterium]